LGAIRIGQTEFAPYRIVDRTDRAAPRKFPLHIPEFKRCSNEDMRRRSWYNRCLPSDLSAEAPAKAEARRRALFDIVNAASNVAPDVTLAALQRRPNADRKKLGCKFCITQHAHHQDKHGSS
jgi:hypothetical protein